MTQVPNTPEQITSAKRSRADSARARRRERRKEARRQAMNTEKNKNGADTAACNDAPHTSPSTPSLRRPSSCASLSSAATSCTDVSSTCSDSCCTPKPKRPQHEKLTNMPRNKQSNANTSASSKRKNKNKKTSPKSKASKKKSPSKPKTVEVEDISDEEKSSYVAIDCEMVGVGRYGHRSALARVSIVNWEGDIIVDSYVKVDEEITDYRTFVSGITAADLESENASTFDECRSLVLKTIKDKVVVGHALKNDFDVLRIHHEWSMIRDTARYEPFMKAHPTEEGVLIPKKLKDLARDKLGLIIQEDGKEHDSIEDATAAMELFIKHRRKWEKAIHWKINKTKMIMEQQHKQMLELMQVGTLCAENTSPEHITSNVAAVPVHVC